MNPFAGPVEISGFDIAVILLAAAVMFLGPPIAGAFIGRWVYRRQTLPQDRTSHGLTRSAVIGAVVGVALIAIVGFLEDLLV